ncbi:MAG: hypothetical protein LBL04_05175 [Bacteroidales bacterium]|jgi:hypothetical protein|nr:hypothetical protein [Bacteroidales bacterium]
MTAKNFQTAFIVGAILLCSSCQKDNTEISTPPFSVGKEVSDAAPLTGSVKGTMTSGKTYYVDGEVTINRGDTLLIQPGVTVYAKNATSVFIVKGVFLSLGTKEKPVKLSVEGKTKQDSPSTLPENDPAMAGLWGGVVCDMECPRLILKWTNIEYTGSHFTNPPIEGLSGHGYYWGVTFLNPEGTFVMEDCHMYGANTEGVRIMGGYISILRNKFEKIGLQLGDAVTIKGGGTQGDVAYNVFIGCSSQCIVVDNFEGNTRQVTVNAYNNTIINSGWRTARANEVYGITYFRQAAGLICNNAIVNCRGGLFLDNGKPPKLDALNYGYNSFYADTKDIAENIYPWGSLTEPKTTDLPTPSSYLPAGFQTGGEYDGSAITGVNNPLFKQFTIPCPDPAKYSYTAGHDFHINTGSPLIGKGTGTIFALKKVPIDPNFGVTEYSEPGSDIGAYPTTGIGNKL